MFQQLWDHMSKFCCQSRPSFLCHCYFVSTQTVRLVLFFLGLMCAAFAIRHRFVFMLYPQKGRKTPFLSSDIRWMYLHAQLRSFKLEFATFPRAFLYFALHSIPPKEKQLPLQVLISSVNICSFIPLRNKRNVVKARQGQTVRPQWTFRAEKMASAIFLSHCCFPLRGIKHKSHCTWIILVSSVNGNAAWSQSETKKFYSFGAWSLRLSVAENTLELSYYSDLVPCDMFAEIKA